MRKFTAFTLILTLVVVAVGADIFANDILPKYKKPVSEDKLVLDLPNSLDSADFGSTNVLGADIDYGNIPENLVTNEFDFLDEGEFANDNSAEELIDIGDLGSADDEPIGELIPVSAPKYTASASGETDFEDDNFVATPQSVLLREDQIRSAGFANAYLETETHDGFLFKTIYINDLYDVDVQKSAIKADNAMLAKVYVFKIGPLSSLNEVYEVLKMRATEGLDIEVNETNDFGDGSFYMNDSRRSNVAFLTVKIGSVIYGFSYPKEYHAQIKNLVTLLDREF